MRDDFERLKAIDDRTQIWPEHDPDPMLPGVRDVGAILAINSAGSSSVHCTALAITSTVVITAAHCFTSRLCQGGTNDAHDDSFTFVQGSDATDTAARQNPISGVLCYSADPCSDVALARLRDPLPFDPSHDLQITDVDATIQVVKLGYGASLHTGAPTGYWKKPGQFGQMEVNVDPTATTPSTYSYSGSDDDGKAVEICDGDSGGPGIQRGGDIGLLVGLTSTARDASAAPAAAACNPYGTDTRLAAYGSWVISTLPSMSSVSGNQCP